MILLARLWPYGLAVLLIAAAASYGYRSGQDAMRARLAAREIETRESRDATDRAVDRLPDGAALDELLREWSRGE